MYKETSVNNLGLGEGSVGSERYVGIWGKLAGLGKGSCCVPGGKFSD